MALVKKRKEAFVFQRIYKIEDSFDIKGMTNANREFQKIIMKLAEAFSKRQEDCLLLGARAAESVPSAQQQRKSHVVIPSLPARHLNPTGFRFQSLQSDAV